MRGDNRKKNSFHFSFRWMNFVSPCFALSSLRALWLYQFWFICVRLLVSRFCATRARPCIPISGSMAQSANDQRLRKRKQKMFLFFFLREAKGDFERCELRIVSHFAVTKSSRMCFTNLYPTVNTERKIPRFLCDPRSQEPMCGDIKSSKSSSFGFFIPFGFAIKINWMVQQIKWQQIYEPILCVAHIPFFLDHLHSFHLSVFGPHNRHHSVSIPTLHLDGA